jgi:hypothetical protein
MLVPAGPGGLGRVLVGLGALLLVAGLLLLLGEKFPALRIGRLPGDLSVERPGFRFYFPLGTSIALSVILSLLLWLFSRRG